MVRAARCRSQRCNDFRVQEYRGQPVLTWWEGAAPIGYGFGHFVICNSSYERIAELQVGNGLPGGDVHEFLLTPRGTALVAIYHPVQWPRSSLGGLVNRTVLDGIVQEIEIEIETGRVLFEWHSLDHIDLEEADISPPERGEPLDYLHINTIEVDTDDNLIISGRHTHAIYKIDRETGEIIWRLNGKRSDFRMGPNARFAWQHDARRQPNGTLTLFDNHESSADVGGNSRGMLLDLDMETMTATLRYQYIHPTAILSVSQGNMQVLPNGNLFIGWGSAPVFSEFGPEGDLRFNGRLPGGVMSYRAYRAPWSGHPTNLPDIAAEVGTSDRVTLYASWNVATEVSRWRMLSGSSPDEMQAASPATVPRTGFETRIEWRLGQPYAAVQALDDLGNVLGTSVAVSIA